MKKLFCVLFFIVLFGIFFLVRNLVLDSPFIFLEAEGRMTLSQKERHDLCQVIHDKVLALNGKQDESALAGWFASSGYELAGFSNVTFLYEDLLSDDGVQSGIGCLYYNSLEINVVQGRNENTEQIYWRFSFSDFPELDISHIPSAPEVFSKFLFKDY